jgi:rfaE bifunctional protein nucleotidyltransferase chain/domain
MVTFPEEKQIPFTQLEALSDKLKAEGRRIVTTNGCFDILHWGHIKYLFAARALGDVLICGVNADASVKRLKGPTRPINDQKSRALALGGLAATDYVVVFEEDTPVRFLKSVRPDIHVKGGDYEGKDIPERVVMEVLGGEVVCIPLVEGFSTTATIERLREK